ncbi:hypothetical protein SSYRP_v1c08960 [Spiroplasma syrphidicola EA-1]|uniref:Uncharacterized protein n=1 Tax=Spiroplasma syrphidicola EA-1 TaxID=1276229 RepID=R4UJZ8_9MOLU|nr:DUF4091 domain-containing protein [Spiroplasma syrphidicola]AGM26485.1 hypothetical protein SSYRP_v1c08960 [Spiroplasma syrphidicola EA-1]
MKLLSLRNWIQFLLVGIIVPPFVMTVISCTRYGASGNNNSSSEYVDKYNFQYGCSENNIAVDDNNFFHTFYGDAKFNYSAYNLNENNSPVFYGNRDNLFRCSNDNPTLTAWKNEHTNIQLILLNKQELNNYQDLSLSVESVDDEKGITADPVFLTYIKSFPKTAAQNHTIYPGSQYIPDAFGEKTLAKMDFNVQPVWISLFVNQKASTGIHKMKLTLKFSYNDTPQVINRPFEVNVKNYLLDTDDSSSPMNERFGFSATSFPSNPMSYINLDQSDEDILPVDEKDDAPTIGPIPNNMPYYLRAEKRPYLLAHLKALRASNNFYLYGPGWNHQLIQWTGKLKKSGWSDEKYDDYISKEDLNKVLKDQDWEWTFDFNAFDEYLRVVAQLGFTEFLFSAMAPGTFTFFYLKGDDAKQGVQTTFPVELIRSNDGRPGKNFDAYLDFLHSKFIKALSDHWNKIRDLPEFKTPSGEQIHLAESFDEISHEAVKATMDNVKKNDQYGLIDSSVFAGWRFHYDPFNEDDIQNIFLNQYDEIILQYREVVEQFDNLNIYKLRSNIIRRQSLGHTTMLYTSWNNFPAAYLQSDNSEQVWGPLMAFKVGANGYVRWSYDLYDKDYYALREMAGKFESGDDNLVYVGDINGPRYSTRFKSYVEGVQAIHKLKTLMKLYPEEQFNLNRALNGIGFASSTTRDNKYKWYPNKYQLSDIIFEQPGLQYHKTIGEQVYELIYYLNSF